MKILLLGSTGYLGGNIAYKLIEEGHDVICVVRRTSDTSRLDAIGAYLVSNEPGELELILKHNHIDWVINGVATYKTNDTLYGDMLDSNIIFPLGILNLAVKYHVKNYITIGTSLPDEFNLYSFTKCKFADFGRYLTKQDNINFADLKLEMFYGGLFEPENRFLSSCKEKMLRNEDVDLTEGHQKRDLIRVEDVVGIISKIIETDYLNGYKKLPIGSGEQHSIREIMQDIRRTTGSSSRLNFGAVPSRIGEPETIADTTWYKDIDYKLKYNFIQGLEDWCMNSTQESAEFNLKLKNSRGGYSLNQYIHRVRLEKHIVPLTIQAYVPQIERCAA